MQTLTAMIVETAGEFTRYRSLNNHRLRQAANLKDSQK